VGWRRARNAIRRMAPLTVNVIGSGVETSLIACLSRGFGARGITKGSAVGTFSTSITTNPDNPSACGDFSQAKPGDCPFNPQIALYTAGNSTGDPPGGWTKPALRLWNPRPSEPDGNTVLLKCANDNTIATNFFPKRF